MLASLFLASKMVAVVSLLWISKVLLISFKSSFSLISFRCRSQAVIESSIGCLPLSLAFLYMVSTPYNLLDMDNNKVAAIPSL